MEMKRKECLDIALSMKLTPTKEISMKLTPTKEISMKLTPQSFLSLIVREIIYLSFPLLFGNKPFVYSLSDWNRNITSVNV
jgi:hypothetical protein